MADAQQDCAEVDELAQQVNFDMTEYRLPSGKSLICQKLSGRLRPIVPDSF